MTSVNTNVGAIHAMANMKKVSDEMDTAINRLSSGLRINSAADDAAGNAIASRMESQIRGLEQAMRNASDGQNLIDTAEGAQVETLNILQRLRELAVQSANDTNSATDRTYLKAEQTQLIAEIDRISSQTSWNGEKLLDGTFTTKQLQLGAQAHEDTSISISSTDSATLGAFELHGDTFADETTSAISGADLTVVGHLGSAVAAIAADDSAKEAAAAVNADSHLTGVTATAVTKVQLDTLAIAEAVAFTITGDAAAAISVTITATTDLQALTTAINAASGTTGITATKGSTDAIVLLTHSEGKDILISGFDTATNTNTLNMKALDRFGAAVGSNNVEVLDEGATTGTAATLVVGQVSLSSIAAFTVSGDDTTADQGFFAAINGTTSGGTASLSNIASINIGTVAGAESAIAAIDGAIGVINNQRSDLGAISNRLESTQSNLSNIVVNTKASKSNIEDADFAAETSRLTRAQILNQAATSMLAQANASKQSVLSLLQG
jgi:flagellin